MYIDIFENNTGFECSFGEPPKEQMWIDIYGNLFFVGNSHHGAYYYVFKTGTDILDSNSLDIIKNKAKQYCEKKILYSSTEYSKADMSEKGFVCCNIDLQNITCPEIINTYNSLVMQGDGLFCPNSTERNRIISEEKKKNQEYREYMSKNR